ncbi:hypothetical protein GGI07_000650 [Coemansia sp. Benny D115]|nr:hypothetical protein GGI07_000650 [Coemansia sp. Benny D115]
MSQLATQPTAPETADAPNTETVGVHEKVSSSNDDGAASEDGEEGEGEEDDEEEEDIFVAEQDLYAPLEDDDDDGKVTGDTQYGAAADGLDDAFRIPGAPLPSSLSSSLPSSSPPLAVAATATTIDLDRILDARMDAELRQRSLTNKQKQGEAMPASKRKGPLEVRVVERMSAEHVAQIKDIMKGIQLGDSAIPEWAKSVPESSWMPTRSD